MEAVKLTIDRSLFLKALTHAQSVVERRTTVPVLAHVLLEAREGQLKLTATDLDLSYTEVLEAHVEAAGLVTVPAHMLYDIVRKLPAKSGLSLAFNASTQQLVVTSGKTEFVLSTLPSEDFPVLQQDDLPYQFALPATQLKELIDSTRFAMATEETRYYLNGLYWHPSESSDKLRVVATDGHRLSRAEVDLPQGAAGMPGVILSRKTVTELRKIIDEVDSAVAVALSETQIRFEFNNTLLVSRLIDGTFPDYQRVIPDHNDKVLHMERAIFAEAVDRVAIITNERSRAIKLSLSYNNLVLSASNTENGSAREDIQVDYTQESLEIGFNARYLLDVTSHLRGDNVEFCFSDATAPVVIRDHGNANTLYVLMPMRV